MQEVKIAPALNLANIPAEMLRECAVDIRAEIESPLWKVVEMYERQARSEIDRWSAATIQDPRELQDIQRRLIEKCEPVYNTIAHLYGLSANIKLVVTQRP